MLRRLHRAGLLFLLAAVAAAATLPTPEQFAGFPIGADKKLVRWERIVEYMRLAAAASPRLRVEELGKTTNGNPFLVVTISAPETLGDLARYKEIQHRLAYPRDLSPADAEPLIEQDKAVLLITCNIHSTEIGSSQMALDLVYRLATEDSPFVRRVLDNVIFLLVPSLNPDGQIIVTDWYNKILGTPYEHSFLPELYHKYTGHDDNRDSFMNTQAESRMINRLTYKDWFPEVFLDEHQMGNAGPRIFVPPFKDPINPNVDPVIWETNGMLGYAMGAALNARGFSGVISDAMYTSWWQGGFLMQAWWHNMVGLLTEVASANVASPVEQERVRAGPGAEPASETQRGQPSGRDPRRPLPPPRDVTPRGNYPRPWLGGRWSLRDIVDYELTATYGLLEAVANNRDLLVRNFYHMNRKQMRLGSQEAPYAWVVPRAQHDPPVAARLMQILDELGVEVHQAAESFEAGGQSYPAGSYVVLMSQPFRAFAKDLLEKQEYPPQRVHPGGPIERPYDVTGWTLPYQMGVEAVEIPKRFEAKLELLKVVPVPAGKFEPAPGRNVAEFEISNATNNTHIAVNRLLKAGHDVAWNSHGFFVRSKAGLAAQLEEWTRQLGIDVKALPAAPSDPVHKLRPARIALYRPWLPDMDEGWTRWLLEQYEFPYTPVRDPDIKAGRLHERFDAILIADESKTSLLKGVNNAWTLPPYRGGLGTEGVAALKEFVRNGGTLVTLGSASLLPIEEFPLPLKNALKDLRPDQFSCPGSILKIFVDNTTPAGYGMPDEASAVFYNNVAFDSTAPLGDATVHAIAKYPAGDILQSGWIGGPEHLYDRIAAAEVTLGRGRVILLGFGVQHRAQPHGTFKLLFNSLRAAGAM
ncbi:MAG TPA: M14 metallopeptidase family protein [Bryobacterales bacterium]|nr:M14 metallopeptidase family protein [Bryobacterales bacterium]